MTKPGWGFGPDPAWLPPDTFGPDAGPPLLLTPDMIVLPGAAPPDATAWLNDSAGHVAEATAATLALLAAETQPAAAALPVQLARDMRRPAAPRATAPRLRPARGAALAAVLHVLVLALLVLRLHHRPLTPPPDAQVISLMMVAAAAPGMAPQPAKPATPPPAPAMPKPAPPAPLAPAVPKPADLAVAVPAIPRKPAQVQTHATPAPAQTAARPQPAPRAAMSANATIPARPDSSSSNAAPVYPLISQQLGEEGPVLLSVVVLPDGSVASVSIKVSTGYPRLDDAARDTLLHWRFHPALKNGVPVISTIPYYFDYSLH